MDKKYSIIELMIKEADAYANLDHIEQYIQSGMDLSSYPVQPLYVAIKNMPLDKVANILPKFSKEQRQLFLDLDLWRRDKIDIASFTPWVKAYAHTPDVDTLIEFAKSSEFLLFLKGRFTVATFDVEDPKYPDNDNYFLSDDRLLIFEYDEKFPFVEEVKHIIEKLYDDLGVEDAYAFLFKLTVDCYLEMEVEEFNFKKERLKDIGFLDYLDALEVENSFANIVMMDHFITSKKSTTGAVDQFVKNQIPSQSALVAFKDQMDDFHQELLKVSSDERNSYLHYTFVKLINATIIANDGAKKGILELSKIGKRTLYYLRLGLSYIKSKLPNDAPVLDLFSFLEVYRVGISLIRFPQRDIKKALKSANFDESNEKFLGDFLISFLDRSFKIPLLLDEERQVIELPELQEWHNQIEFFKSLLPFITSFHQTFGKLLEEGKISNSYYRNYELEDINFESIILSTFFNFLLEKDNSVGRLGVSLEDFKVAVRKIVLSASELSQESYSHCERFAQTFGLAQVHNFPQYLQLLLTKNLLGYEFDQMSDSDYKHVGGPIIFA